MTFTKSKCRAVMGLLAIALAVAACTTHAGGQPVPQLKSLPATTGQTPPGSATTSGSSTGAPAVPNPLDTQQFEHDPCSVIAKPDAGTVLPGVDGEADPKAVVGPTCDWYDASSGNGFSGGFAPGGLRGVYQRHAQGVVKELDPMTIHGYPAAIYGTDPPLKNGECALTVGVADDKAWVVTTLLNQDSEFYSDPCSVVKKAAELGMATMTKGA